jgi:hypothetical protein
MNHKSVVVLFLIFSSYAASSQELIQYNEKGKVGFRDASGKVIP